MFTETVEEAVRYRDFFRAQHPPTYNRNREFERPIPPQEAENDNQQVDNNENGENSASVEEVANGTDGEAENAKNRNNDNNTADSIDGNEAQNGRNDTIDGNGNSDVYETIVHGDGIQNENVAENLVIDQEEETPRKPTLAPIGLDESDIAMFGNLFGAINISYGADTHQSGDDNYYQPAANEIMSVGDDGQIQITKIIDDDCEITYPLHKKIVPAIEVYAVKLNDKFSKNIPFQENVSSFFLILSLYIFMCTIITLVNSLNLFIEIVCRKMGTVRIKLKLMTNSRRSNFPPLPLKRLIWI